MSKSDNNKHQLKKINVAHNKLLLKNLCGLKTIVTHINMTIYYSSKTIDKFEGAEGDVKACPHHNETNQTNCVLRVGELAAPQDPITFCNEGCWSYV